MQLKYGYWGTLMSEKGRRMRLDHRCARSAPLDQNNNAQGGLMVRSIAREGSGYAAAYVKAQQPTLKSLGFLGHCIAWSLFDQESYNSIYQHFITSNKRKYLICYLGNLMTSLSGTILWL